VEKIFSLREHWKQRVTDSRIDPDIPTSVFPAAFFAMFCCRFPSFNSFVQQQPSQSLRRWLGGSGLPSADELAWASERIDLAGLRACLGHLHGTLKRNKVIGPRRGWTVGALDAHEINASYKRGCDQCLQRKLKVGGVEKIQYYYRIVVLQIISEDFYFLMDLEPVLPGEDEVSAALRLMARVLESHPRCFDVITADAIYLRPSMIDFLLAHGKHLIAVLKDNQPELLDEARRLLSSAKAQVFATKGRPGNRGGREVTLQEADGFTTESICTKLRVVHAHEVGVRRERIAGEWVESPIDSHWYWASTMEMTLAPGGTIFELGHDRWRIENEGFNELVTKWHSRHMFHHHANTIQVLWLMLFMAHAAFHCFYKRNLKPALRVGHSVIYFAELMQASFRSECWWPRAPA
jgi:Transposase DDE domain